MLTARHDQASRHVWEASDQPVELVRGAATKEIGVLDASLSVMGRRAKRDALLGEIEEIYVSRLHEFRRVATAITGSHELGCDAVQDGFARAVHRRADFREDGSLAGWVWRIVVTAAHDARRRRGTVANSDYGDEVESDDRSETNAIYVREVIARLPERQRLALFLRYYADLDYSAIAEVLGSRPAPSPRRCTRHTQTSAT